MKRPPCRWLERNTDGRPRCEHGWAIKSGHGKWRCRKGHADVMRRYRATDKGRAAVARVNQSPGVRSSKQLYELTRIRVT